MIHINRKSLLKRTTSEHRISCASKNLKNVNHVSALENIEKICNTRSDTKQIQNRPAQFQKMFVSPED